MKTLPLPDSDTVRSAYRDGQARYQADA